jgi:hypothetical protein
MLFLLNIHSWSFETIKEHDLAKVKIPAVLNTPVSETLFMRAVRTVFGRFNVHVSKDLPKVMGKLCRALNYSITNPKQSALDLKNIWVFPAETGTGKSVALQVYIAMLIKEASLIVVSTRDEAYKYAATINELSGDDGYARAIFSEGGSKKYPRASDNASDGIRSRCLIITHKRLQDVTNAKEGTQNYYRFYQLGGEKPKRRELVVVDEKLSFASRESVTLKEYDLMVDFVENALVYSKACRPLGKRSDVIKQLRTTKSFLDAEADSLTDEEPAKLIEPEYILYSLIEEKLPESIDLQLFENVVETRFDELSVEINSVMSTKDDRFKREKSKTLTLVKKFSRILQKEEGDGEYCDLKSFALFKTNQITTINKFKQFYSTFGTCLVLDATATVNKFYSTASTGRLPNFDIINLPKIRKYTNLNIYTAKGFSQSRHVLCATVEKIESSFDVYKPVIESLKSEEEKLLVIGHKSFIDFAGNEYFGDDSVALTYWGNHVGKNDWNDCSKVLVVGWNYLPPLETVTEVYGAYMPSGDLTAISKVTKENMEIFSTAQLAEDIIQAVMRTRARIIADNNSDCLPAEVYLMYPDRDKEQDVIDLVVNEFPGATINTWEPPVGIDLSGFTKPQKNAYQILLLLDDIQGQGCSEISWKDVREKSGFSPSTFSKAIAEDYFEKERIARGIEVEDINGRQKKFVF